MEPKEILDAFIASTHTAVKLDGTAKLRKQIEIEIESRKLYNLEVQHHRDSGKVYIIDIVKLRANAPTL